MPMRDWLLIPTPIAIAIYFLLSPHQFKILMDWLETWFDDRRLVIVPKPRRFPPPGRSKLASRIYPEPARLLLYQKIEGIEEASNGVSNAR